jgi:acyl-CoA synthetase (AMP-forming)/AMP-acid ligase II
VSAADLDEAKLSAWCRRFLGDGTTARYHVVRELPRTANGKVLRNRARLHAHRATPQRTAARYRQKIIDERTAYASDNQRCSL